MIDTLRARFLGRFIESARQRLHRARTLEAVRDDATLDGVANELHGLGGEASMLELSEISRLARSCENAARRGDRDSVRQGLQGLQRATEALEITPNRE
jgi:HPt (histidine-containing phosphotransfer) domain-containing protein